MNSQKGFTLIEIIIAVGVGSVVAAGSTLMISHAIQNYSQNQNAAQIAGFQNRILLAMNNPSAWNNTLNAPQNAASRTCLTTGNTCVLGQMTMLALFDQNNSVVFDSTNLTNGFSENGGPCNTFSSTAGNSACPFRYDISWSAYCNAGICTGAPQIMLRAQLRLSNTYTKNLNPFFYSINGMYLSLPSPPPSASCGAIVNGPSAPVPVVFPPKSNLCSDGSTPPVVKNASGYSWNCGSNACQVSFCKKSILGCPGYVAQSVGKLGALGGGTFSKPPPGFANCAAMGHEWSGAFDCMSQSDNTVLTAKGFNCVCTALPAPTLNAALGCNKSGPPQACPGIEVASLPADQVITGGFDNNAFLAPTFNAWCNSLSAYSGSVTYGPPVIAGPAAGQPQPIYHFFCH